MITVQAPDGVGEVRRGDDLADLLLAALTGGHLADGDVVCVTVFDGSAYVVPQEWGGPLLASDAGIEGTTLPAGCTGWFRN